MLGQMTSVQKIAVLEAGERLLAESASLVARGWCQGTLALDDHGRRVEPWSESATRWSPLGALLRSWYESPTPDADAFRLAYSALATATGGRLEEWNAARWRTHRHVLNAFGRARIRDPAARPDGPVGAAPTEAEPSNDALVIGIAQAAPSG